MVWALDKQQAKEKYTQITLNGLPKHTNRPEYSETHVKAAVWPKEKKATFGSAVAIRKDLKSHIKCFIKWQQAALFDTFSVLLAN